MNSIATNTLQLNPDFADQPTIHYFPRESSRGDFFSIWWGHGMHLLLSPQQIHSLREAILSSPEVGTIACRVTLGCLGREGAALELAEGEAKP